MKNRLAEAALEHYRLRGARLELMRQRSFAEVFRVVSRRGEFVLRIYNLADSDGEKTPSSGFPLGTRPEYLSTGVLRAQLRWLSALGRESNLLVPEPVPTNDGALLGHISTDDLTPRPSRLRWAPRRRDAEDLQRDLEGLGQMSRTFALVRWVPGEHKKAENFQSEDASLVGSYVARLHRHAEGRVVPEGSAFPRWGWERVFGEAAPLWREGPTFYSASELKALRAIARDVWEDLEALGYDRAAFGIIHGDLKLDNAVFRRRKVGLIDFEACGWGHYLFDLSRMRESLRRESWNRLEPLWSAFLEGYRHERPLAEDYERYLETFNLMQRVAMVNKQLGRLGSRGTLPQSQVSSAAATVAGLLRGVVPVVETVRPSDGAKAVRPKTRTVAAFSKELDPATVNSHTFYLHKEGSSERIPAAVSYDTTYRRALLDSRARLTTGATYIATVKGGPEGMKDTSGRELVEGKVWSFTVRRPQEAGR